MRLKTLTRGSGFKSFPDSTRLDFGPGVSVVVGPNGSGKSNVTDAVLWAMGEQSPLAVRGQSMQDVIFGGGHGVQARSAAEVEIVLDNSDGTVDLPLSEISIVRRLDRAGEGGYRLNGARCRLTDVIEVLSDTGLGKETHSVISQGRVEAIVTSKPRERRLLIEEAAGLGKHRKRRRRAQLKLERTQENLDRALDVEREARTRLRPLKRQAEAAELHERLERQVLDARWELAREALRARGEELERDEAPSAAHAARRAHRDRGAACRRWSSGGGRPSARSPSAPSATTRSRGARLRRPAAAERLELRARAGRRERAGAGPADRAHAAATCRVRPARAERDRGADDGRGWRPSTRGRRGRARSASTRSSWSWPRSRVQREQEIEREIEGLERRARARDGARGGELEDGSPGPGEARARRGGRSWPRKRANACGRASARRRTRAVRPRGSAPSWRWQTSSCAATRAWARARTRRGS